MKNLTKRWLTAGGAAAASFLVVDGVWITTVAKGLYDREIPHLMASTINAAPAAVFYVAYLAGTVHLAVRPADDDRPWTKRLRDGAILGAVAYGTWGFTASSVLREFPVSLAIADCAWGAALTGATAVAAGAAMDTFAGSDR